MILEKTKKFRMNFISREKHLRLTNVSSIIVVQKLYEILFQYAISKEKEAKLKKFIDLVESHIKSKSAAPFSMPISELAFLDEGLEELKLLNWMEIPVSIFEIEIDGPEDGEELEAELEKVLELLEEAMILKRKADSRQIYVYPLAMTRY